MGPKGRKTAASIQRSEEVEVIRPQPLFNVSDEILCKFQGKLYDAVVRDVKTLDELNELQNQLKVQETAADGQDGDKVQEEVEDGIGEVGGPQRKRKGARTMKSNGDDDEEEPSDNFAYFVHYKNWGSQWDEWVRSSIIKTISEESRREQQVLKMAAKKGKVARKPSSRRRRRTNKKRGQVSPTEAEQSGDEELATPEVGGGTASSAITDQTENQEYPLNIPMKLCSGQGELPDVAVNAAQSEIPTTEPILAKVGVAGSSTDVAVPENGGRTRCSEETDNALPMEPDSVEATGDLCQVSLMEVDDTITVPGDATVDVEVPINTDDPAKSDTTLGIEPTKKRGARSGKNRKSVVENKLQPARRIITRTSVKSVINETEPTSNPNEARKIRQLSPDVNPPPADENKDPVMKGSPLKVMEPAGVHENDLEPQNVLNKNEMLDGGSNEELLLRKKTVNSGKRAKSVTSRKGRRGSSRGKVSEVRAPTPTYDGPALPELTPVANLNPPEASQPENDATLGQDHQANSLPKEKDLVKTVDMPEPSEPKRKRKTAIPRLVSRASTRQAAKRKLSDEINPDGKKPTLKMPTLKAGVQVGPVFDDKIHVEPKTHVTVSQALVKIKERLYAQGVNATLGDAFVLKLGAAFKRLYDLMDEEPIQNTRDASTAIFTKLLDYLDILERGKREKHQVLERLPHSDDLKQDLQMISKVCSSYFLSTKTVLQELAKQMD